MNKVLLYNDKIFLNARSFYEFILINVFDGEAPRNWNLEYVAVCFTNKLKTIAGIKVDWFSADEDTMLLLQDSKDGWIKWTGGADKTFTEFIAVMQVDFTKEDLWRWAIDYVVTYDIPRMRIKRLVDDVLKQTTVIGVKNGVQVHRLNSASQAV